jgi:MFS family permease
VQVSTTSLAVNALRPGTPLATVPLALFFVVAASTLVPVALLSRRTGRAPVFLAATALAVGGAALQLGAAYVAAGSSATTTAPLAMLSLGAALQGISFSTANNYRFVAAEFIDHPPLRPRAISLVVCCAVIAAALGPEVSRLVVGAVPGVPYAGAYAYLMAIYGAQICALLLVDWRLLTLKQKEHAELAAAEALRRRRDEAEPLAASRGGGSTTSPPPSTIHGTPYRQLLLTRDFITAAACCAGAFAAMAALMALTPLRVVSRGLGSELAAHSVVAHIAAMYLPALVMGDAVRVFGVAPSLVAGFLTLMAGTLAFLGDGGPVPSPAAFYSGMILIGVGWSAAYVAASSLAASCYAAEPPARRFPVQAATDTCVLLLSGLAMGSATPLLRAEGFGWPGVVALYAAVNASMALLAVWWGVQRWVGGRRRGEAVASGR